MTVETLTARHSMLSSTFLHIWLRARGPCFRVQCGLKLPRAPRLGGRIRQGRAKLDELVTLGPYRF